MNKDLLLRLVIPLSFLSVITVVISLLFTESFDASGFLINLSTDFLSIIFTVLYVDWVINSNKEKQWKDVYEQISTGIRGVICDCIVYLYKPVGLFEEIAKIPPPKTNHEKVELFINTSRKFVGKDLEIRLCEIDIEEWTIVVGELKNALQEIERLIDRFQAKMTPEQVSLLLGLERDIKWILYDREVFDVMAQNQDPRWERQWKKTFCPSIANHMTTAADKLTLLLASV